jgi:hypothetical protein
MIGKGKARAMSSPEKPLSESEIDALYGLEPALDRAIDEDSSAMDKSATARFVVVDCPYCGEPFETTADASAGMCSYVEDCQICCQPIEMELRVDEEGRFSELVTRRGDA